MKTYWLSSGFYTLLDKLTQMAFNLGGLLILWRLLEKDACGTWILFTTIAAFVEIGRQGLLQNAMITFLNTRPKSEHSAILTASVVLNMGLSVISVAVLLLTKGWLGHIYHDTTLTDLLLIYSLTTFVFSALYQFNFVQQANLDFKGLFFSSFLKNGIPFAFLCFLFLQKSPIVLTNIAWVQLVAGIPATIVAYLFAKKYLHFSPRIDKQITLDLLNYGRFSFGTNISTMIYKNVDKLILGSLLKGSVSTYDLAIKINTLSEVPTTTLATIMLPQSAKRHSEKGNEEAKYLYERSVGLLLTLLLPVALVIFVGADWIVYLLGSEKYANSAPVLRLTVFYGIFMAYAVQFGTVLDSIQKPRLNFYITLSSACVNLICNYLFIKAFGLYGAAYGTLTAMSLMFVVMQFVLYKNIGVQTQNTFIYMLNSYKEIWAKIKDFIANRKNKKDKKNPTENHFTTNFPPPTMQNRELYDIVIFTLFRSDNAYSSVSLSMAKELAKKHRVFYINHPYSVKDILKERKHDAKLKERMTDLMRFKIRYETLLEIPNLTIVCPPPTLPINWLPKGKSYDWAAEWNNKAVETAFKAVVKKYSIKNYIYYNCFNPFFLNKMPKGLLHQPTINIYQCIDDLDCDAYTKKHGSDLEKKSVKHSDITLVTANQLQRKYVGIKPETYVMNNAVDISIFRKVMEEQQPRPKEMELIVGKIIGFTGNLDHLRINYTLMRKIAIQHPDKTLFIVGPINADEYYKVGLDKLPNVISVGAKKIQDLPNYVRYFDVAIIPFSINEVTKSIYPLKINEYLTAGRAVVATNFSEDIRSFKENIYLAEDEADFVRLIDVAITEDTPEKRQKRFEIGAKNTWTDRVEEFWGHIERHIQEEKKSEPKTEIILPLQTA